MRTYYDVFKLAVMSVRGARSASSQQVARELWKIAQEYQAEAAQLDSDRVPDIGDPPQGVEG
jgi:hypothetical protein